MVSVGPLVMFGTENKGKGSDLDKDSNHQIRAAKADVAVRQAVDVMTKAPTCMALCWQVHIQSHIARSCFVVAMISNGLHRVNVNKDWCRAVWLTLLCPANCQCSAAQLRWWCQ